MLQSRNHVKDYQREDNVPEDLFLWLLKGYWCGREWYFFFVIQFWFNSFLIILTIISIYMYIYIYIYIYMYVCVCVCVCVRSPDGETDFFDIVAGMLRGDTLAPYLFIICLAYVLRTSIDLMKENGLALPQRRSRRYPHERLRTLT